MKVLIQNLNSGAVETLEAATPQIGPQQILVQSHLSLLSTGTEKMLLNFGKANLLQKARQQPDRVKEVIAKAKTDGIIETFVAVKNKLDDGITLGYCNVGTVLAVGTAVTDIAVGDRVASNAPHADVAVVSKHLCAKVPKNVSDSDAVFTVVASIALQSVRLADPQIGESVAVFGAGLIGQLVVQILLANGCQVYVVDFDSQRLKLAQKLGAQTCQLPTNPVEQAQSWSQNRGVDAVIVCASTDSSDPLLQAAEMCRQRGRIILAGVTGMQLQRELLYRKELTLQVSCSYGPGRYDDSYEIDGKDYPLGYVRWTEQRNFMAVLQLMATERLKPSVYIDQYVDFEKAAQAYQLLEKNRTAIGIVLQYSQQPLRLEVIQVLASARSVKKSSTIGVEVIGAGLFSKRILLPILKKCSSIQLINICSNRGVSASHLGKKYAFQSSSTTSQFQNPDSHINAVFIASRHSSHADYVVQAMSQNKNIFVEKPLAISCKQLADIEQAAKDYSGILMLGFNRRYATLVQQMRQLLEPLTQPKAMIMTVNAGRVPQDNWQHDKNVGGGRIVGEACHFIDLLQFLCQSTIASGSINYLQQPGDHCRDIATINLCFSDGSIGTVHYFANGDKAVPKERLEVHCGGKTLLLNNFRTLQAKGFSNFSKRSLWRQDKGHKRCIQTFIQACQQGTQPMDFAELLAVSRLCVDLSS